MYLGWLGYAELAVGGAALQSKIPFGPFMLLGAGLGIAAGAPVAGWYLHAVGV